MFHRSLKGLLAQLFFCFYAPRFVGEVRAGRFSRASRKTNREVVQEVSRRRLAEDLTVVHRDVAPPSSNRERSSASNLRGERENPSSIEASGQRENETWLGCTADSMRTSS